MNMLLKHLSLTRQGVLMSTRMAVQSVKHVNNGRIATFYQESVIIKPLGIV